MTNLKQVILVRNDIKMSKGKVAAQVAHAAVNCALNVNKKLLKNWQSTGMKKVTLKVDSLEELYRYQELAEKEDIINSLITDAGHTEIAPGTQTVLAIGPGPEIQIDKITGELKIY
jgi:PTH2 family peptidyl-tRNA hydrolase